VSAIAFCNTKVQCRELVEELQSKGFSALALYGELEQRERDEILVLFANRSCSVLVATDVAARGLDIQNLEAVINVDVSKDTEVHIHRVGRTGRGNEKGLALSLCAPNEKKWVKLIEEYQGSPVQWFDLDSLDENDYGVDPAPMMTLVHLGRQEGQAASRRPAGRTDRRRGPVQGTSRQDQRVRIQTYVAIDRRVAYEAFDRLSGNPLGGDFGDDQGPQLQDALHRRLIKRLVPFHCPAKHRACVFSPGVPESSGTPAKALPLGPLPDE
jgi:ATP-independent RNA helicase DbpA